MRLTKRIIGIAAAAAFAAGLATTDRALASPVTGGSQIEYRGHSVMFIVQSLAANWQLCSIAVLGTL